MAFPLVKAVRQARPDAQISLIVRPRFIQFLGNLHIADLILPIEKRSKKYYQQLFEYRRLEPDFLIRLANNSTTGDIEALIMGAHHNFSQHFPGKKRPWFSECVAMDRPAMHQNESLRFFVEQMGYRSDWDLKPIDLKVAKSEAIGLICGSENSPEKRWPTHHWIDLIAMLIEQTTSNVILFGTSNDVAVIQKIGNHFSRENRVIDRAGKTDLEEFSNEIAACRLVIGNDTGGVHLSNFLGIPTVVLFGPTNPHKTRPIFEAPVYVVQSPDPQNFATLTPHIAMEIIAKLHRWV
jgi:ADP-heptose:LPS heptosyltransferase